MQANETLKFFEGLPTEIARDSQDNLYKLLGYWQVQNVTPFIGAGVSMAYGYPGWTGYIRKLADDARLRQETEACISAGRYEEAADGIVLRFGQRKIERKAITNASADDIRATGERVLSGYLSKDFKRGIRPQFKGLLSVLPNLALGPVVTTNFDHVLEEAFEAAKRQFKKTLWGDLIPASIQATLRGRSHVLIKLHGDVDEHMRVLTLTQYAQYYGSANPTEINWKLPLPKALEYIFTSTYVVFIGCSLNNDRTLEVLRQVHLSAQGPLTDLAFVEWPSSAKEYEVRNEVFNTSGIHPIWYPTHKHETIELILDHIAGELRQWRTRWMLFSVFALVLGIALGTVTTQYFAHSAVLIRPQIADIHVEEVHGTIRIDVSYTNAKPGETTLAVTKLGLDLTTPIMLSVNGDRELRVPSEGLGRSEALEICLSTKVQTASPQKPLAIISDR